jgi:hypothetical protein
MTFLGVNPELRRSFWLELTPQRLIAMPAVLGLTFALALVASDGRVEALVVPGQVAFYAMVLIWGCRRAAASMANEVHEGTWDWQRMSSIGPWSMSWGKLLGSTSFVWYGAGISLAAVVAGRLESGPVEEVLLEAAAMAGAGLLGHTVSLAAALAWLRKIRPARRVPVTLCQILGIGVGYQLAPTSQIVMYLEWLGTIDWYGFLLDGQTFLLASLLVFLAWGLLATYRLMQAELQVRMRPWAWPAFTLFAMLYVDGLFLGRCARCSETALGWIAAPYVVATLSAYLALFLEPKDIVRSRALLAAIGAGGWRRATTLVPFWLVSVLLLVVTGGIAVILTLATAHSWDFLPVATLVLEDRVVVAGILAHFGFVARDFCLILALNFGTRPGRADMAAVIYLAMLYLLAPWILYAAGLDGGSALFLPGNPDWPWLNLVAAVLQALAGFALLAGRWRGLRARFEATTQTLAH